MKIFGLVVLTEKNYYKKLEESVVEGYYSAVNMLDGKKKVYLEPVTIKCERATVKDCAFLGCLPDASYGLKIENTGKKT